MVGWSQLAPKIPASRLLTPHRLSRTEEKIGKTGMRKLVGQDGDRDQLLLGVEQTPNPSLPTPSLRACIVFTRGRAQSHREHSPSMAVPLCRSFPVRLLLWCRPSMACCEYLFPKPLIKTGFSTPSTGGHPGSCSPEVVACGAAAPGAGPRMPVSGEPTPLWASVVGSGGAQHFPGLGYQ